MKTLLAIVLSMGLLGSANASVPVEGVTGMGGFGSLSVASQLVGFGAVAIVLMAIDQSSGYTCNIVETGPLPGSNLQNEKSICTK